MEQEPIQNKCSNCTRPLGGENSVGWWDTYAKDAKTPYKKTCDICKLVEDMDEYKKNERIKTKIMTEAYLAECYVDIGTLHNKRVECREFIYQNYNDLFSIYHDVEKLIKPLVTKFEEKHWHPYLKKYWNDATKRGHNYNFGNKCSISMWGFAGRALLTFEKEQKYIESDEITLIFSDSEKDNVCRGGIQSIDGRRESIIYLLEDVIKIPKIEFKVDEKVTLAGL